MICILVLNIDCNYGSCGVFNKFKANKVAIRLFDSLFHKINICNV